MTSRGRRNFGRGEGGERGGSERRFCGGGGGVCVWVFAHPCDWRAERLCFAAGVVEPACVLGLPDLRGFGRGFDCGGGFGGWDFGGVFAGCGADCGGGGGGVFVRLRRNALALRRPPASNDDGNGGGGRGRGEGWERNFEGGGVDDIGVDLVESSCVFGHGSFAGRHFGAFCRMGADIFRVGRDCIVVHIFLLSGLRRAPSGPDFRPPLSMADFRRDGGGCDVCDRGAAGCCRAGRRSVKNPEPVGG